ncbi:MAG: hypothetical protein KIT09_17425 [Bryobacteraceae bacterium]|nr:hypothetical protein [Bryobacteraceae bacterium]
MKLRLYITTVLIAISLSGQKKDHGTVAETGSIQDYSDAGATSPIKSGPTPPATCTPLKEFFNDTDAPAGQRLLRCKASGTEWEPVDSGGGTLNHSQLSNLDYATSGHTGFASDSHRSRHQHGGADEVATSTATAYGIPKATSVGTLDRDWLPTMVGDSGGGGSKGAVPRPEPGDGYKCLKGDGTWGDCGAGGTPLSNRGDIHTHDGTTDFPLPVGSNEQFLVSNEQEATGLKWTTIRTLVEKEAIPVSVDRTAGTQDLMGVSLPATQAASKAAAGTHPHTIGFLTFPDGIASMSATWQTAVPQGWDGTGVELLFRWTRGAGTGSAVAFDINTACVLDNGDIVNPAYNSAQSLTPGLPTADRQRTSSIASLNMTGCAERRTMFVRISRDPTKPIDDFTGTVSVYQLMLRFYVKPQFQ